MADPDASRSRRTAVLLASLTALLVTSTACALFRTSDGTEDAASPSRRSASAQKLRFSQQKQVLADVDDVAEAVWAGRRALAYGTGEGDVYLSDLTETGDRKWLGTVGSGVTSLASDGNGGVVVVGSLGQARAWTRDGRLLVEANWGLGAIGVDAGGERVAFAGFSVAVQDLASRRLLSQGQRSEGDEYAAYNALAFGSDALVSHAGGGIIDTGDVSNLDLASPCAGPSQFGRGHRTNMRLGGSAPGGGNSARGAHGSSRVASSAGPYA